MTDVTTDAPEPRRRNWLVYLPLVVTLVVGGFLAYGLTQDPNRLPSALLGEQAPQFDLPSLEGRDDSGFSTSDLTGGGEPVLVNVFASWCVPCRIEHPLINALAEEGFTVHGLNYKDGAAEAKAWLAELGDPFAKVGFDQDGRAGLEWGVYGVPETFVVAGDGTILHKHVGPLTPRDVNNTIRPLLEGRSP